MSRRHYLVTYDIADDKRRNRVFDALHDHGDHAQFSVFFCQLTQTERISLESLLTSHIHHDEDQVLFVDLGKSDHDLSLRVDAIGKCYHQPARCMIV